MGWLELIVLIFPIALGYFTGRYLENKHYKSIHARERHWQNVPAVTFYKSFPLDKPIERTALAVGSVVVSVDYFKRFLAGFRNLFGGEMKSYSSVIDRGRREALLRMRESRPGADAFINCRIETSSISKGGKNMLGCSEVVAYGTAIFFRK